MVKGQGQNSCPTFSGGEVADDKLTVEQVAQVLGVTRATVYNLIRAGRLTKYQNAVGTGMGGRRVYFLKDEVDKLRLGIVRLTVAQTPGAHTRKKRTAGK